MKLQRLTAEAEILLTDSFVSGRPETLAPEDYGPFLAELPRDIDLGPVGEIIDEVIATTEPNSPAADIALAPELHRRLRLTRREAADAGVWRFLAVVFRPQFVRHRWGKNPRRHFWEYSSRPRPEHNAFSRLWWIAELTQGRPEHGDTPSAVEPRLKMLFKCQISHCPRAVVGALPCLADATEEVIAYVIKDVNRRLAFAPVEGLSQEEVGAQYRVSLSQIQLNS